MRGGIWYGNGGAVMERVVVLPLLVCSNYVGKVVKGFKYGGK